MNREQNALLELVNIGAGGECLISTDVFDADWNDVFELAQEQGVVCVAWHGLEVLYKNGVDVCPAEIKLQWYGANKQAENGYNNYLSVLSSLCDYMAENGFKTMILKGYGLSLFYRKPYYRPLGDIDIFQFGRFKEADELLEKKEKIRIDRSHHNHTVYSWEGVTVENHYSFINCYSHLLNKRVNEKLISLAMTEEPVVENGMMLPSPNLTALYTFVHTAAHFAAESVELRRLCDWWLLRKKLQDKVNWGMVEAVLDDCGFMPFYKVFEEITTKVFEAHSNTMSKDAQRVLEEIVNPRYGNKVPTKKLPMLWFKLRRWWEGRWKMRLVYSKESLLWQFVIHTRSNLMNPEKLIS